jgi:hypothetical protein
MFKPGLANLLESFGVIGATVHPIQILRNHWMIGVWQLKPIQIDGSSIAGGCCDRNAHLRPGTSKLLHGGQIPYNNVGARGCSGQRHMQRRHDHRLGFTINELRDLDWLHPCANRDFSNGGISVCGTTERVSKLL